MEEAAAPVYILLSYLGNKEAAFQLAKFYREGSGVEKDNERALSLLLLAARGGYLPAQLELARNYESGEHRLKMDHQEAARWYRQAALQGDPNAQVKMVGYSKDDVEVMTWLTMAADQGHAKAQEALGFAYLEEGDNEMASHWLGRAVLNGGSPMAARSLGKMLIAGDHVFKDTIEISAAVVGVQMLVEDANIDMRRVCGQAMGARARGYGFDSVMDQVCVLKKRKVESMAAELRLAEERVIQHVQSASTR